MRVMLSAAGSAVAPGIIRHLQSLGHYVIGHDCCEYVSKTLADEIWASPEINGGYFRQAVTRRMKNCDLYLPFLDEELVGWADKAHRGKTLVSSLETIRTFTSKLQQQWAMEQANLPVAPSVYHIVIKPDRGRGGSGIRKLFSGGDLMQQLIDGNEYTVDVLTDMDGAFLFAVPRLRIKAKGVSIIGQIEMDAEIIDLARQVVSKFAFRGPINIQIIRELPSRKLYIIELNPRLSGSCMFTVMAGFDILDATIKLWEGKPFVPPDKIEDGLVVRRHYVEERL